MSAVDKNATRGRRLRCSLVVTLSDTFLIPNKTIAATISSIVQNSARLLGATALN